MSTVMKTWITGLVLGVCGSIVAAGGAIAGGGRGEIVMDFGAGMFVAAFFITLICLLKGVTPAGRR